MKNKYVSWLLFVMVFVLGVLASRSLFKHNHYFQMHDDLQMMRQLQLEKCFLDLQIPCRWVPDMGYGFGFPLFNYYPQLPYLFGELFRLLSLPFNDVAKLTFALGIIGSGFAMYLFAKEFYGRAGGLVSAAFYIWAPYRALDVYVRGAMNESWAWVWFPLILLGIYKLLVKDRHAKKTGKTNWTILLSLSTAALLLTHNLMVVIFLPVALVWTVFWIMSSKNYLDIRRLLLSGVLALGLAAFFTIPSIFEQKYVHIDTLTSDYFQYFAHFATFKQLFISRYWGDGPSIFGPNDEVAFPIGQVHWVVAVISLLLLLLKFWRSKKLQKSDWLVIFGVIVGTGAAFMVHEKSTFLWKMIPKLEFVQFPWRFLTLNVLGYSLAAGGVTAYLPKKILNYLAGGAVLLVVSLNWTFFKPIHDGPLTDSQKFSGEAWRIQSQAGILDYLPKEAKDDPTQARIQAVDIIEGEGKIVKVDSGTNWLRFSTVGDITKVRVNLFNYPVWKAFIDQKEVPIYVANDEINGLIYIDVPSGEHNIYLKLKDTLLRKLSNMVSIFSWVGLAGYILWKKRISTS